MPNELRPLIAYLFTEWKCNLDCHYCWSYDNSIKGMTEPVAKASIDWLHSIGNRFLALMGGEPLLRPKYLCKVVDYAAKKDFSVYLPTNGRLMKPDVIDRLGDAGLGSVNLAIDVIDEKPGLAKALTPIKPYFDHLLKQQRKYCYQVFLNVCITRTNMDDVRAADGTRQGSAISASTYHIVESPLIDSPHFKHLGREQHVPDGSGLSEGGSTGRLDCPETERGIQGRQSARTPAADEGFHARQDGAVGLPRGQEHVDHSNRWDTGAVLPDVLGDDGLGNGR